MSKWKITIEHVTDDGEESVVSLQGSFTNDGKTIPELCVMANDLAHALSSFQHLARTTPCEGDLVLGCFTDVIEDEYGYWGE